MKIDPFPNYSGYRIPQIKYPNKMKEKSVGQVLRVDLQDPNTSRGITEVLKNCIPYVSNESDCGNVRRKVVVNGIWFPFISKGP